MIVTVDNVDKEWQPKNLNIRFETEKEFTQFKEMIRHCDTVPDAILDYGSKIDRDFVHDFMSMVFNTME
jgi:hypothetical protein